jgi:hypothetical protein
MELPASFITLLLEPAFGRLRISVKQRPFAQLQDHVHGYHSQSSKKMKPAAL